MIDSRDDLRRDAECRDADSRDAIGRDAIGRDATGPRPPADLLADLLDETGWRILTALQADARQSYAAIARQVGLTPPAVAGRMRRMEETGLIQGYRAQVNRAALGERMCAFVRIRTFPGKDAALESFAAVRPEILECHEVAGEDSYLLRVAARDVKALDRVVTDLAAFGTTNSLLVLSTKVAGKPAVRTGG